MLIKFLFKMFLWSVLFVRQVHCHTTTILNIVKYLGMILRSGSIMDPEVETGFDLSIMIFHTEKSFIIEWS